MADSAFLFGVLGPLQMSVGGREVPLGAAKQRAVLALLLINRNRPVAIDSLIDAMNRCQILPIWDLCHYGYPDDTDPFADDFAP